MSFEDQFLLEFNLLINCIKKKDSNLTYLNPMPGGYPAEFNWNYYWKGWYLPIDVELLTEFPKRIRDPLQNRVLDRLVIQGLQFEREVPLFRVWDRVKMVLGVTEPERKCQDLWGFSIWTHKHFRWGTAFGNKQDLIIGMRINGRSDVR